MNRSLRVLFSCVIIAGFVTLALAISLASSSPIPSVWVLLALFGATIVGEMATIGGDIDDGVQGFSLATTAHLCSAILLLPGWAAIIACAGTAVGELVHRARPIHLALNASSAAFCTLATGAVFHALQDGHPLGVDTYLALAAGLAVYVPLNLIPPGLTVTILSDWALRPLTWVPSADLLAYVMEACLAASIALVAIEAPSFLVFLVPILAAVFLALKRGRMIQREARQTLRALVAIIDAKDPSTAAHSERVGDLAARLGEAIGLGAKHVRDLRWAARLHDIGKVAIDDSILQKNGELAEHEWELMRRHPAVAAELLGGLSLTRPLTPGIRYHHERADGSGYYLLPAAEIPVEASIIAIVDAFDAMTTHRPYRPATSFDDALGRIVAGAGAQFDADLARAFVEMMQGRRVNPVQVRDDGWRASITQYLRDLRRAQGKSGSADPPTVPARSTS